MSCGRKRSVPLELCVDLGDCSCPIREVRSPLSLLGAPQDSSRIAAGMNRASSRVEARTSGFLPISDFDPKGLCRLEHESQASYCVEEWNSACLWSSSPGDRPLVELYLEPAPFSEQCNGGVIPLSVVTSSSGLHSKSCPGIGTYLEWTGKSLSFLKWHYPKGFLLNFNMRPASSRGVTVRSGSLCRHSRWVEPRIEIRRGEGA